MLLSLLLLLLLLLCYAAAAADDDGAYLRSLPGVRVLHTKLTSVVEPILAAIDAISNTFVSVVNSSRADTPTAEHSLYDDIGQLMTVNHGLLVTLGVGHSSLDTLCAVSRRCAARHVSP